MRRVIICAVVLAVAAACEKAPPPAPPTGAVPAQLARGEALFNAHCAACHGQRAMGTDHGPPFINPIYEPHHHGNDAFLLAARRGVRAHHWQFGDMPPVPDVTEGDVGEIVSYIRWLQQQAGVY